ncbi:hypothetical protein BJI67_11735 [Acidihalobacter aeolianus]|uniref:Uncharacterized protein n=2 Tax=Acidihalobacter aeolianus TaxID=2792603 RepID=A0A1D8K9N0_9GAMM|nr:hypothetical protein BJI67_11735 [Acidihalobacter aeolianus]
MAIVKFSHDKTLADFMSLPPGLPPGAPIGGITGEASHQVNYLVEDFKKGSYAILCFLPAKNGKMHA